LINKEKNTLVILTPGFPESETDTTCLPLQQSFVKNLHELYPLFDIIILSFQYPYHTNTFQWFGSTVICFNGQNKAGLTKLILRHTINLALREINKNKKIAGILSFWYGECALAGNRFGKKNNLKHFCWLFGQDARKENRYPKQVNLKAGELIALSDFLQDSFEKNHAVRPLHLVPPGIDLKEIIIESKEKNIDVLGAGSLIPLKQFDLFLEIIAEIKKEIPAVRSVLVGAGPEKEKLKTLITTYGLQDNVLITGEISHDKVLLLMQQAKVFLHTSSFEGFSGVCLEALSCGAQVISFCRAMKKEIEHWHIVPDKVAMKQKTLDILQNANTSYRPVFPFLISETVKAVAALFVCPPNN
jgi:glycosyltransferase involved in cell wall biosynthesis